ARRQAHRERPTAITRRQTARQRCNCRRPRFDHERRGIEGGGAPSARRAWEGEPHTGACACFSPLPAGAPAETSGSEASEITSHAPQHARRGVEGGGAPSPAQRAAKDRNEHEGRTCAEETYDLT